MAEIIKDKGDVVRLTVAYANTLGTYFDPTTLELRVRTPSLITFTPLHFSSATGRFYADVTLYEAGVWTYRWTSQGLGSGAEEGVVFARPNTVT